MEKGGNCCTYVGSARKLRRSRRSSAGRIVWPRYTEGSGMHALIGARRTPRRYSWWNIVVVGLVIGMSLLAPYMPATQAAVEIGYTDFSYSAKIGRAHV